MSKGSGRRPSAVPQNVADARWARAFGGADGVHERITVWSGGKNTLRYSVNTYPLAAEECAADSPFQCKVLDPNPRGV